MPNFQFLQLLFYRVVISSTTNPSTGKPLPRQLPTEYLNFRAHLILMVRDKEVLYTFPL